ncbi:hypothetical protein FCG40_04640 [Fimbriimonadia bacterium ATM]|nr:MAG: hypothetical protein EDM73_08445 [Armatimonadota bacterium]MBC6969181.1 hypothetical protein [Armatimonadota bacterium]MCE7900811.1 hypothetical protein [Armatimonadetes bacterium ATM1]MDL1928265.1 hypothetical protein [Fimbriimonadia bacterium ATM]RIJ97666.1 MAG: hypothetical protein DCC45_02950 [Armatimonadota bacterium]
MLPEDDPGANRRLKAQLLAEHRERVLAGQERQARGLDDLRDRVGLEVTLDARIRGLRGFRFELSLELGRQVGDRLHGDGLAGLAAHEGAEPGESNQNHLPTIHRVS